MLRRAKGRQHHINSRIPRRGRIRAALALIILIIAAIFFAKKEANEKPQNKLNAGQMPAAVSAAQQKPKPSKQLKQAASLIKKGKQLSHKDVSALIKQHPPRFSCAVDTLRIKGRAIAMHYSLDTSLQAYGKSLLHKYHPKYGAIVALHPSSGRILAMVSYNHPDETPIASNLYCKSIFPAASIIKIITAAGAVEKGGLTGASAMKTAGKNHTLYNFQLARELKDFREVSFREAFAYSINPVFGRIGIYILGAESLKHYLDRFGFNEEVPFELCSEMARATVIDLAFALAELASGFNQRTVISPLFGALIAAAVSNDGVMNTPTLVDSVIDISMQTALYTAQKKPWRIPIRKQTAAEMRTLMQAVARFGTARKSFMYVKRSGRFSNIPYGGKTGNIDMDAIGRIDWFVGFARHNSIARQHIALCVAGVHGPYWTVHSSFLGAEMIRHYIRNEQLAAEELQDLQKDRG